MNKKSHKFVERLDFQKLHKFLTRIQLYLYGMYMYLKLRCTSNAAAISVDYNFLLMI